ncbi:hypothetical protein MAR_016920 [Mya arenaria]|uniref:Uncharacterized protein n=1 Tax=Mya arenaria TaxID=6604 RepID=A0ABY7EDE2_MYAAR|nr:hypothetical protein MAR_016920 [Mya arenaria]
MALSKLPKMFGFSELAKGYFPHLYNKKEHHTNVLDHLPDLTYCNPDAMSIEPNSYIDVDILRRFALRFRQDFMHVTGVDPFEKSKTIASACQRVCRTNLLSQESLGLIPSHGYNPEQLQSVKALQWLKYLLHTLGIRIHHARNGGEKVIGPYKVDGYYKINDQKVVLEFHGDFWHGNPVCMPSLQYTLSVN